MADILDGGCVQLILLWRHLLITVKLALCGEFATVVNSGKYLCYKCTDAHKVTVANMQHGLIEWNITVVDIFALLYLKLTDNENV